MPGRLEDRRDAGASLLVRVKTVQKDSHIRIDPEILKPTACLSLSGKVSAALFDRAASRSSHHASRDRGASPSFVSEAFMDELHKASKQPRDSKQPQRSIASKSVQQTDAHAPQLCFWEQIPGDTMESPYTEGLSARVRYKYSTEAGPPPAAVQGMTLRLTPAAPITGAAVGPMDRAMDMVRMLLAGEQRREAAGGQAGAAAGAPADPDARGTKRSAAFLTTSREQAQLVGSTRQAGQASPPPWHYSPSLKLVRPRVSTPKMGTHRHKPEAAHEEGFRREWEDEDIAESSGTATGTQSRTASRTLRPGTLASTQSRATAGTGDADPHEEGPRAGVLGVDGKASYCHPRSAEAGRHRTESHFFKSPERGALTRRPASAAAHLGGGQYEPADALVRPRPASAVPMRHQLPRPPIAAAHTAAGHLDPQLHFPRGVPASLTGRLVTAGHDPLHSTPAFARALPRPSSGEQAGTSRCGSAPPRVRSPGSRCGSPPARPRTPTPDNNTRPESPATTSGRAPPAAAPVPASPLGPHFLQTPRLFRDIAQALEQAEEPLQLPAPQPDPPQPPEPTAAPIAEAALACDEEGRPKPGAEYLENEDVFDELLAAAPAGFATGSRNARPASAFPAMHRPLPAYPEPRPWTAAGGARPSTSPVWQRSGRMSPEQRRFAARLRRGAAVSRQVPGGRFSEITREKATLGLRSARRPQSGAGWGAPNFLVQGHHQRAPAWTLPHHRVDALKEWRAKARILQGVSQHATVSWEATLGT